MSRWDSAIFGVAAAAASSRPSSSTSYLPEVDSLRAYAMTMVVAMHCGLLPFGWMGVWLFFVISGFAVTTSILGARKREPGWGRLTYHFYLRRCLRIWPVYFLYIGLCSTFLIVVGRSIALENVPYLSTFTFNLWMIFRDPGSATIWGGFEHLWTISVEQTFYVFYPFVFLLRTRRRIAYALAALIVAAPLVRWGWSAWTAGFGWNPEHLAFAVYAFAPAHFDAFALGSLIALFRPELALRRDWMIAAFAGAGALTLAYVGYYAALGVARVGAISPDALRNVVSGFLYGQGREVFCYWVPSALGAALLIGLVCGQPACRRLCAPPALQAIGRVSYGGYLFHVPVIMALMTFLPALQGGSVAMRLTLFACTFAGTVAVAGLSFVGFEQRFLSSGRRLRIGAPQGGAVMAPPLAGEPPA
jgi:peptidoglycan/LPS O-acetylase OafA/YrhL